MQGAFRFIFDAEPGQLDTLNIKELNDMLEEGAEVASMVPYQDDLFIVLKNI